MAGLLLLHLALGLAYPIEEIRLLAGILVAGIAGLLLPRNWALCVGLLAGVSSSLFDPAPWRIGHPLPPVTVNLPLVASGIALGLLSSLINSVTEKLLFLQTLNRATGDVIYLIDTEGNLAYVNEVTAELLGFRREEMIGKPAVRFAAPWYRQEIADRIGRVLKGDYLGPGHIYLLNRKGESISLISRSQRFEMGGQSYALGVAQNVTGLEQTEMLLSAAFDALDSPAVVHSPGGRVIACNQAFADCVGRSKGAVLGEHLQDLISVARSVEWQEAARSGQPFRREVTISSGTPVAVSLFPIRDERGRLVANISMGRDLRAEKEAEGRMIEAAQLAAVGQTAAGVAHNINNLLAAISVSAELLKINPAALGEQAATDILDAVDRGSLMVRTLYRLAGTGDSANPESLSVQEVLQGVLQLVQPQLTRQGVTVHRGVGEGAVVRADASMLHQVLMNIVINGLQAMTHGGTLTFESRELNGQVELRITDTGGGIPAEHMNRIFTPFFTTKRRLSGTGLGLSTSLIMARAMGGDIHVENRAGHGATFIIQMPVGRKSVPPTEEGGLYATGTDH